MKKASGFIIIIVVILLLFSSCTSAKVGYDSYFYSFKSAGAYTKAEEVLNLKNFEEFYKENAMGDVITNREVYITSYNYDAGVFIITETISFGGTNYTLNGLCSENELYIEPKYLRIIDIFGDYAIVTKMTAVGSETSHRIGMVKFRGENKGYEYGFTYGYVLGITQYMFLNEQYVIMLGHKDMNESGSSTSSGLTYNFATVYDYTTANGKALLEVARINNVTNTTTFCYNDGNIVANAENTVRFYKLNSINDSGFLNLKSTFTGFTSEYDELSVSSSIYYIGNNWYVVTMTYATKTSFDTYEMTREQNDTTYYVKMRSVRYNTRNYQYYETDRVALVANKYTDKYIRSITDSANATESFDSTEEDKKGYYLPPVVPTSSSVKDGYSIVYYYFPYYSDGIREWGMSFSIYDTSAARIELENVAMPLVFIDGIGLQNGDPNFNVPVREAEYYTLYSKRVVLQDTYDLFSFDTYLSHSDMIMAYRLEFIYDYPYVESFMGAYDKEGNIAVPFIYNELTLFFGNYATGTVLEGSGDDSYRTFYRISKTGAREELDDVYFLKDGVYITKSEGKYGIKANDGTVLIENKCEYATIISAYLKDGLFVQNIAITAQNGLGIAYRLS